MSKNRAKITVNFPKYLETHPKFTKHVMLFSMSSPFFYVFLLRFKELDLLSLSYLLYLLHSVVPPGVVNHENDDDDGDDDGDNDDIDHHHDCLFID